jgi:RNA polymerase sigma-54 factor
MQKHQLTQKLKLKLSISQQTIQLMKLIELSNNSLEQEILKEIEENPALEIDMDEEVFSDSQKAGDDYDRVESEHENEELSVDGMMNEKNMEDYYFSEDYQNFNSEESDFLLDQNNNNNNNEKKYFDTLITSTPSFHEFLIHQLQDFELSEDDYLLAEYIIGYIDDSGYIETDLNTISTDFLLAFNVFKTENDIENIIKKVIHQLEPDGVGARSLQEALLLQLKKKEETTDQLLAITIIQNYFDEFSKKQYERIIKKLKIEKVQFNKALSIITKLSPKPVLQMIDQEQNDQDITPDFIITSESGKLNLQLNNPYLPKIQISRDFQNTFARLNKNLSIKQKQEAEKFLKENIENANQFINSLNLRELVLYNTMYAIMDKQKEYFLTGDNKKLKPMVLKDIAEIVNLDISTISRVSNSKYVQTSFGTISLKNLFSESIGDENTSSKEVKQIIKEIVEMEDEKNPLQDEDIKDILNQKGYNIARRTVSKYRKQLNIQVARLRAKV